MTRYSRVQMSDDGETQLIHAIDTDRQRFPHCIVWTPLPVLSWFFPLIGHMGIASVDGVIYDFCGPYTVTVDNFAFGQPTKYWQLDLSKVTDMEYDTAVLRASEEYRARMHNLCCDNCHSHVAMAMNLMKYEGRTDWNMVNLTILMVPHSKFTGFGGFLKTYLPSLLLIAIIAVIVVFL